MSYRLRVNGVEHDVVDAWLGESLLFVLRERLGLPGSKNACEQGECGSCSVFVDDRLVCSCLVLGASAIDRSIVTVEGVGDESGALSIVQRAFVDAGAVQCGFCTPGFVMACKGLLGRNPRPSAEEIEHGLGGNLCRCGTYAGIRGAIAAVSGAGGQGNG